MQHKSLFSLRGRHLVFGFGLFTLLSGSALIAGTTVPDEKTPFLPKTEKANKKALTYVSSIAPILTKNCATCHRPGEVAPFSLLTYEEAKKRARQIAAVAKTGYMPPWKDAAHGVFQDERRLTPEEVTTLNAWAEAGAPKGDAKVVLPTPKFKSGWKLGEPDFLAAMTEPYKLGAEGKDVYRCFVIPTNYAEDRWVTSLEVAPGNRKIVHHVIAYLDTSGAARKLDEKDPGPGYTSSGGGPGFLPVGFLGGWAPGNEPRNLPEGVGIKLPKGADIVLEVHYHKSGKEETDQTKVALHFCKSPVDKQLRMLPLANAFFQIPPGAANHPVTAAIAMPRDVTLLGITPHMHLLGRNMKVTATTPDGKEQTLVHVPDWDFNWQITYSYKQPVKLPQGTKVSMIAHYDNSEGNVRNPSRPPKATGWGEQTTDEMCLVFLGFTVDQEHLTKGQVMNYNPVKHKLEPETPKKDN